MAGYNLPRLLPLHLNCITRLATAQRHLFLLRVRHQHYGVQHSLCYTKAVLHTPILLHNASLFEHLTLHKYNVYT